jgi:hypothetical protein
MTDLHEDIDLQRESDDRGVVLVLVALLITALLITVAFVIDFGQVRQTRQSSKSVADFAVTAGMRGLETPGVAFTLPWGGVCTALEYLESNHPGLTGLTGTYRNGSGTALGTDPCSNRSVPPYTTLCDPDTKATWAWFDGTANGGATKIDIRNGYETPDADFPEDLEVYTLDNDGDPAQKGCDQLAVIIGETDSAAFGGAAGATSYSTRIRSVGRVDIGEAGEEAVALLLLEQRSCDALVTQGNSTSVFVRSTGDQRPGLIHLNSDGSSGCTGSARTIVGGTGCYAVAAASVDGGCSAPGTPTGPQIVAEAAVSAPGVIGARAVATNPTYAYTTPACATHAANVSCTMSPVPVNRGIVTREPVDRRYLEHVRTLKTRAQTELARSVATATTAGYAVVSPSCAALEGRTVISEDVGGDPTPAGVITIPATGDINIFPLRKVFLDCNLTQSVTFGAGIDDVVVKGYVEVSNALRLDNVRRFYVRGRTSGGDVGFDVTGSLFVNARGQVDTGTGATFKSACEHRFDISRTEVAEVVVLNGSFEGGTAAGDIHLCSSFLFLANDALPASNGTPPLTDNSHRGGIFIGSQAKLDWKAPNQTSDPVPNGSPLLEQFEDLALWSEYGRSTGTSTGIAGQGRVTTTGVFFMPNAEFNIGGGGYGVNVPADAQFIVRRLRIAGTTSIQIAPDPNNAVPTPKFEAFTLVR